MRTELIYESSSLYRDRFRIQGYAFGTGKKAACIIGSMRGNEYQQLYLASRVVQELKRAEREDLLTPGFEILVIPCANPSSINIQKRFWPIDNTDINRMFPGYMEGETTQRIAGGIFERIEGYEYGIQFASNYMSGQFMPYISVMKTGMEYSEQAASFGMPYVVMRNTRPYDTTTLNYNWQIWETKAFSLYTTMTERIDRASADRGAAAVLRFLCAAGLLRYDGGQGCQSEIIDDRDIISVRTSAAGLFEPAVEVEQAVHAGQLLACVLNPIDGEVLERLYAPEDGIVFFLGSGPLIYEHAAVIKLIPSSRKN